MSNIQEIQQIKTCKFIGDSLDHCVMRPDPALESDGDF